MVTTASPSMGSGTSTPRATDASGYLLLTIQGAEINQVYAGEKTPLAAGELRLECVSLPIPPQIGKQTANPFAPSPADPVVPTHDFWLVVQVGSFELALAPTQAITPVEPSAPRVNVSYDIDSAAVPGAKIQITLPLPSSSADLEDLDSLEVLLRQYGSLAAGATALTGVEASPIGANEDLRGKLLLINEDTGEVVGELDQTINLEEDKAIQQGGDNKPVVLDFGNVMDSYAPKVQVKTVPEDEMDDWMLKGAHHISRGILVGGSFVTRQIQTGADKFIKNTKATDKPVHLGSTAKAGVRLTHNATTTTVNVTKKTVGAINNVLQNVVAKGYEKGVQPAIQFYQEASEERRGSLNGLVPDGLRTVDRKPSLPPRRDGSISSEKALYINPTSTTGPPLPPRSPTGAIGQTVHIPTKTETLLAQEEATLAHADEAPPAYDESRSQPVPIEKPGAYPQPGTPDMGSTSTSEDGPARKQRGFFSRALLAAEVVLTSVEATVQDLITTGTEAASSTAGHKFGPEAGHATALLGGSVRNVAVVYMDVRGIGRKALLTGTAKGFVKARLNTGETVQLQGEGEKVMIQGEEVKVAEGEVEQTKEGIVIGMAELKTDDKPAVTQPPPVPAAAASSTGEVQKV